MQTPDSAQRRFLLAIFVVSGFTGLIYESIWSHYLKLFLGHAAYAQTLVLAIFMGGMALGSWGVARYSVRIRHLLWSYVLVEGLIGVLGVLFHRTFVAASDFSFASVIPALPPGFWIHAYKWSLAALMILPQSVLLGTTFPLISGGIIRRWPDRPGETLATLYFTNSLGAALGVLISGFILIGAVGLPGTVLTAGLLNVVLALLVWLIVRGETEPAPSPQTAPAASSASRDTLARWFVIAAFLTGAASFMYELGWIRMLSLVLSSSTHSFELMLSAFIFGLAFGGLYVRRRIAQIVDPATYVGGVMVIMGGLAALTLPAYNLTFDFMAWCLGTFTRTASGYVAFNVISQSIAALIMIPTTFCAGMTLPLLTQELMRRGTGERAIGTIYSLNTLGAIVGVLLTVHILMPLIGVKGVILAGAGIHMALGFSRLLAVRRQRPRTAAVGLTAGILVLVVAVFGVNLDPLRMASGVYRTGKAKVPAGTKVTYLKDGKTATISLIEHYEQVIIATNGKPDAGLQMGPGKPTIDEYTMILAAAIPLSMHPNPKRVANIGFGSGLTAHTLLNTGMVERLDTIEIEPFMVEAARQGFGPRISNVFDDPRSHIVYEDAKTFFASAREPYDLIVSEPSNPWVSGVATLFSDEFYSRITQYLRPDGYLVQWIQTYETDLTVLASVIKALSPHFGAYAIYNVNDADILIVATRGAALPIPDERIFQSPQLQTDLNRIGIQGIDDLRLRKIGDNRTLGPALQEMKVPPNSDFFPFVDLNAPRLRFMQTNANELPILTAMPIPFLELLGGAARRGSTIEPSANSALNRDGLVQKALAIRRAILDGSLKNLDPTTASYLMLIGASQDECADTGAQNAWRMAVGNISDSTAAYLNPDELQGIWNKVRSSPCYRNSTADQKAWVDLFEAIARRNAPDTVKFATGLLGQKAPYSAPDLAYLTISAAAAYIQMGQISQAHSLMQEQWSKLDHAGPYGFALFDLMALSRSSGIAKLAQREGEKRN